MTPIAARIAEVVRRNVADLRFPTLADAADYIAVRVLADDEIAAGLRDTATVAALSARHQPRDWQGSTTGQVCTCGRGAYPCEDRAILDGTSEHAPAVTA